MVVGVSLTPHTGVNVPRAILIEGPVTKIGRISKVRRSVSLPKQLNVSATAGEVRRHRFWRSVCFFYSFFCFQFSFLIEPYLSPTIFT